MSHEIAEDTDHPRTCGENNLSKSFSIIAPGSPPHMRGKPELLYRDLYGNRITPAHAGKTFLFPERSLELSDHPRTCGENHMTLPMSVSANGSPPHMRGKLLLVYLSPCYPRITPAHAGKTTDNVSLPVLVSDHPRTCGENAQAHAKIEGSDGSPPHMRGKPNPDNITIPAIRITPAHAGKTRITIQGKI